MLKNRDTFSIKYQVDRGIEPTGFCMSINLDDVQVSAFP